MYLHQRRDRTQRAAYTNLGCQSLQPAVSCQRGQGWAVHNMCFASFQGLQEVHEVSLADRLHDNACNGELLLGLSGEFTSFAF